ncbi:sulfhydryl oxidase 1 [Oncorhynchus keta]|uniref:sulfhydryl oxidase 1 n=1 Tax=Oncorhynchus keta TaxID=8018 RepID=UPI0015FA7E30|nr:sulfhydryl oxidase 1 [Oncorhynchus keta]
MARRCCRATSRFTGEIHTNFRESFISTIVLFVCLTFPFTTEAGLYTASDQIVILTPDNVDSVLVNSTAALVVEFYASWCGHCIAFSPEWKRLARDIKEWKPAVDLAAIDCANGDNGPICSRFGVKGYPTLKFFHAYSKPDSKGQGFRDGPRDVRGLRHKIIEKMETHEEPWPPACPPLETASKAEIDNFFETNGVEHLALIFETSNSYVGREVTLDLLQYENIAVRRVLRTEEALVAKLGVTDFPSCYLYYPSGNFTRLHVQNEARTFYTYALQRLPGVLRAGNTPPVTSDLLKNTTEDQWRPFNGSRVYMADLESTLHYSLRLELAAHPVIKGEALITLQRYISVLAKYFPGRPVVRNLLKSVDTWLKGQNDTELSYSSLRDALDNTAEVPNAALPEGVRWVGCQGSKPHFRRYPCGMWTLFHVLTVQAEEAAGKDPQEVLQAMRSYVHSFFGCRACATHFENMAKDSMSHVGTLSTAMLWLWSRHNHVNNRLAGALSEDPHFPKIQWPSPELCPSCHGVKKSGEHTWNQEELLTFLRSHFSSEHLLSDYLEKEAQLLSRQKESLVARQQEKEQETKRGAERRAREALAEPPPGQEEEEEEEEEDEEEAQEEPAGEEEVDQRARGEHLGGKTFEPPTWVKPEADVSRQSQRRPSIVGLKLRPPQEEILDLDSFVNQHYKAKALRAAAAGSSRVKRRTLQRQEEPQPGAGLEKGPGLGLGVQPVEPEDLLGQRNTLQKRILTGQYTGSEEEGALEMYPHPNKRRWMSFLSVGFSRLDISLCVLLYFLSSMCLLAMYLFFKNRLRLRRAKVALP